MEIKIRSVEPADYKAVQEIHAQPNAVRGTLQLPFPSEEMWRKRLAETSEQMHGLVACIEGDIAAMVSLTPAGRARRAHAAYVGMVVHDRWQGKGVGTTLMKAALDLADNWLNLSRLELTVYTDNDPALRLYKKLGFEIEGTHRKYAYREGQFIDAYYMARLRELVP